MAEVKYPQSWSTLKIPQWRLELLATLKELADPVYQQKAWIEKAVDNDVIVGVNQVHHALFEDLDLAADPQGAIGSFLFDADELAALSPLVTLMGAVHDDLGEAGDGAYVAHALWPQVVAAAATARAVLCAWGDPKVETSP